MNKSLFIRLQKIEEKREADIKERRRLEKAQAEDKDNPKNKKAKKLEEEAKQKKFTSNLIEEERQIHEAYQLILNEYYRKVRQRRKAMEKVNKAFLCVDDLKRSKSSNAISEEENKGNIHMKCHCTMSIIC